MTDVERPVVEATVAAMAEPRPTVRLRRFVPAEEERA